MLTITNNGPEVVSLLAVRLAALNENEIPLREWTEIVATPIATCNDWRGPLFPGKKRHVRLSSWRTTRAKDVSRITGAVEISELRLWQPTEEPTTAEKE